MIFYFLYILKGKKLAHIVNKIIPLVMVVKSLAYAEDTWSQKLINN